MTYIAYVAYMLIGTLMACAVWLWTLFSINPDTSGLTGILLFYVSFALMLVGFFALLGLFVRVVLFRTQEMKVYVVKTTFRQGVLLAIMAESVLLFQKYGLMTWWSFALLFVLVISLEFFLSAGHHVKNLS